MSDKPIHAFILAAGKGTRLRPYTDSVPKPLVPVNSRPILDYTLEKLIKDGVTNVTINLSYLGDRIKEYFSDCNDPKIIFSEENELLDTGGGVLNALSTMQGKPFYLINGDALWEDDSVTGTSLSYLAQSWDSDDMDILLLLQPVSSMHLTGGVGDYDISPDGKAIRNKEKQGQYMFTGVRITHPRVFNGRELSAFSFLELMDKAETEGKLYGLVHKGQWHHISTPEDLENVNKAMQQLVRRVS